MGGVLVQPHLPEHHSHQADGPGRRILSRPAATNILLLEDTSFASRRDLEPS